MTSEHWIERVEAYLHTLCVAIPTRQVGSAGNRAATAFFARAAASYGFETESPPFACMDWQLDGVRLTAGGHAFEVFASPYSLGCQVEAPVVALSTVEALAQAEIAGRIVLLRGSLAQEQLMPKNFPFYNPDHHREIIGLLEQKAPAAIIAATSRDVAMVGSLYPFPLIEDGDFGIPSVYMTDVEGERLLALVGEGGMLTLEIAARRIPATGCNVIARKNPEAAQRVVAFAHIDAKMGTPGATDNAGGVAVLLLLAEMLKDHTGPLGLELVALNGEDYYSNPGEQQYLALNAERFGDILLGINVDGVGYHRGRVAYSLYTCPPTLEATIRDALRPYPGLVEGEPWYQGDHGLFLMHERPALAFTSELLEELMGEITHTPADTPEMIDPARLVELAGALRDLLLRLGQHPLLA